MMDRLLHPRIYASIAVVLGILAILAITLIR